MQQGRVKTALSDSCLALSRDVLLHGFMGELDLKRESAMLCVCGVFFALSNGSQLIALLCLIVL